jgi:ATP-dependent exoDNAse (exonuclease V) beta subunit
MEPLSGAKYKGISAKTLEKAANKGTAVHNAIENWTKFGIEDISEEHECYFRAYQDWWNEHNPEVVGSESRVYHKLLLYGGTIDLTAYIDGKLTLVDYKTTYALSDMTCGVQLEAYSQALASHGIRIEAKKILQLKKNGKFEYRDYPQNDTERWRVFGALKTVYDYIQSYQ